jgi:hypothetical protein
MKHRSHFIKSPLCYFHVRSDDQDTGNMGASDSILLLFAGLFELWIVFAIVYAALTRDPDRTYFLRVKDALKFNLR